MGAITDILGNVVNDGDAVAFTWRNMQDVGVYFNNRILTNRDRVNITDVHGVLLLKDSVRLNNYITRVQNIHMKELTSDKIIAINDLEDGKVYVTKKGDKFLYFGDAWALGYKQDENSEEKLRSGRLFINMKYFNTSMSLKDNMLNIIKHCNTIDDFIKALRFSVPNAIGIDTFSYSKDEIKDYTYYGCVGIVNSLHNYAIITEGHYIDCTDAEWGRPLPKDYETRNGIHSRLGYHCTYSIKRL